MKRGDIFTVLIERLDPAGRGLAHIDSQPVLIESVLPEQTVRIEITKLARGEPQPRLARAQVIGVVARGPDEPGPDSPAATLPGCPGAPWLTIPLTAQWRWKTALADGTLTDLRAQVAGTPAASRIPADLTNVVEPLVASPLSTAYRNKVEFSFGYGRIERIPDPRHPGSGRTIPEGFDPAVGFHPPGAWQTVRAFDPCLILPAFMSPLRQRLQALCEQSPIDNYRPWCDVGCRRTVMVRGGPGFDGVQALFVLKAGNGTALETQAVEEFRSALSGLPDLHLHRMLVEEGSHPRGHEIVADLQGSPYLQARFCGLQLRVRPTSFFQTNLPAAEQLVGRLRRWLAECPCHTLLDLYCGAGTLGLSLAGAVSRVIGIESVESAIADACENARENGVDCATYTAATAEQTLGDLLNSNPAAPAASLQTPIDFSQTVAIIDPPRAGLHPKARKALCHAPLARLAYVACNPASLVHDLPDLLAAGYRLDRWIPFDFFPHTPHIELLALLRRD